MKKIIFILLLAALATLISCDDIDPEYNYDKFMAQFGRTYTGDEKLKHERIFNANY